jgi:hypothetical protein
MSSGFIAERNGPLSRPHFFLQPVPLSEFGICLLALLGLQYWAGIVAILASSGWDEIVDTATRISVMPVVEWYMLFGLLRTFKNSTVPAPLALGSLVLIALAPLVIIHQRFAFLVETALLLILWMRTPGLRRIGLILLLIALQRGQGMTPLHGLVSWIDARLVDLLMAAIGHPVSRIGNLLFAPGMPDGLLILGGCASSNLMIPMGLGFVALLLTSRARLVRIDYYCLAATLAAGAVINIVRLAFMLQGQAAYKSWHDGDGAAFVSVAGLIVTLAAWFVATDRIRPGTP